MSAFEMLFELTEAQAIELTQATLAVWFAAYSIRVIIKMLR